MPPASCMPDLSSRETWTSGCVHNEYTVAKLGTEANCICSSFFANPWWLNSWYSDWYLEYRKRCTHGMSWWKCFCTGTHWYCTAPPGVNSFVIHLLNSVTSQVFKNKETCFFINSCSFGGPYLDDPLLWGWKKSLKSRKWTLFSKWKILKRLLSSTISGLSESATHLSAVGKIRIWSSCEYCFKKVAIVLSICWSSCMLSLWLPPTHFLPKVAKIFNIWLKDVGEGNRETSATVEAISMYSTPLGVASTQIRPTKKVARLSWELWLP